MMDRELYETCRVSCQNKFVKLVNLVGFITKKYLGQNNDIERFGFVFVTADTETSCDRSWRRNV